MPNEPTIKVSSNVRVALRKWHKDPKGQETAPNGEKGYYGSWESIKVHNILTDAGRDFLHKQGYETTGLGSNGGNFIALTTNSGTPADSDTTLTGEITTLGLARVQGIVTHTSGSNSTKISKTFTSTGTHTSVQKSGLFTETSGGTLVHESLFTAINLQENDQIEMNWTITLDD